MGILNAGELDRRITLARYGVSYDEDNQPLESWVPDAARQWASVRYVSDGEKVRAAEVGATISVWFQIRYSAATATITPKDRVIYEGKTFDIVGIKELGRREGLEISAAAAADE